MKSHNSKLFDKFWTIAGAVNIRAKILGIVLGLVLLLGLTVTWQVRHLLAQAMYNQLANQAVAISHDLAARAVDPILINDEYALYRLLQDTQITHQGVRYAFIVDNEGYVISHTFVDGFPLALLEANSVDADEYEHTNILQTTEGQIWDTAVPIFEGRGGIVRVGISDVEVLKTLNAVTGQLLLTTVMVSVTGISAAVFLTWVLTRPILDLVSATQAVSRGDFSYRVKIWAKDETGELAQAFNSMLAALAKADLERNERENIRLQYVHSVISAQEDERKRIARELHDSTSQSLTSLIIGLKTLTSINEMKQLQNHADELRQIAGQALDDVHALSLQLRPSVLDDLGLVEAIRRHVFDCRKRHHLALDIAISGMDGERLATEIETSLYRIIQEALTNIIRHSEAQNASILLERRPEKVLVIIEDDGKGFDIGTNQWLDGHLGLFGIRERVELLLGRFTIESSIGQGTSLYIEIPLTERQHQND